jgi:hypothetical protein
MRNPLLIFAHLVRFFEVRSNGGGGLTVLSDGKNVTAR